MENILLLTDRLGNDGPFVNAADTVDTG